MRQILQTINSLTVIRAAFGLLIIGLCTLGAGFIYTHVGDNLFDFRQLVSDLYANAGMELISIAITVLIIDRLNQRHNREERKYSLFRQMRSSSGDVAIAALEEIQHQALWDDALKHHYNVYTGRVDFSDVQWSGVDLRETNMNRAWLDSANLQNSRLDSAKLQDVVARGANLQGANLSKAEMQKAVLEGANLQQASLEWANFTSANLQHANLQGARLYRTTLHSANLQGACLRGGSFLDEYALALQFNLETVLPDAERIGEDKTGKTIYSKYWIPGTDMNRYTDPKHPDFWEPEWARQRREKKGEMAG